MGTNRIRRDVAAELRRGGLKPVRSEKRDGVRVIAGLGDTACVVTAYCNYGDTPEAMGMEARDCAEMSATAEMILTAAGYTVRRISSSTFGIAAPSAHRADLESFRLS
ncbi:hypothetical protein ACVBEQ_19815 [Nakamurella sp. GG22]